MKPMGGCTHLERANVLQAVEVRHVEVGQVQVGPRQGREPAAEPVDVPESPEVAGSHVAVVAGRQPGHETPAAAVAHEARAPRRRQQVPLLLLVLHLLLVLQVLSLKLRHLQLRQTRRTCGRHPRDSMSRHAIDKSS